MPVYQTLLYSITKNVCTITLNRPEVYNALKEAEKDSAARCLIIRGAGEKAFCSLPFLVFPTFFG